jgi:proteic killer suppression protein
MLALLQQGNGYYAICGWVPPGNQLEALSGDRKGQMSIRINRQWRVCFVWTESGPDQVEICDYH